MRRKQHKICRHNNKPPLTHVLARGRRAAAAARSTTAGRKQFVRQTQEDIKRLGTLQQETLKFEQQKAQNELAQKLVKLALQQVREKLSQRLTSSIHSAVNNFQIVLFTNYKAS